MPREGGVKATGGGSQRQSQPLAAGNGETLHLWRAVDHEGEVLESYVAKKWDKAAALRFFKNTLKRHGPVEKIFTDGLRSYPTAMRDLGNLERREMGRHQNKSR